MGNAMQARSLVVLAVTAILTGTAGCTVDGGGAEVASLQTSTSGPTAPSAEQGADFDKYRACLRENGVELESGKLSDDGNGQGGPATVNPPSAQAGGEAAREKAARAAEKCRSLTPDGGVATTQDPELLDMQRAWARCLREKGYDVPDPSPDGRGNVTLPDSPEANKAVAECQAQAYGDS
jgi:hypothetical protein